MYESNGRKSTNETKDVKYINSCIRRFGWLFLLLKCLIERTDWFSFRESIGIYWCSCLPFLRLACQWLMFNQHHRLTVFIGYKKFITVSGVQCAIQTKTIIGKWCYCFDNCCLSFSPQQECRKKGFKGTINVTICSVWSWWHAQWDIHLVNDFHISNNRPLKDVYSKLLSPMWSFNGDMCFEYDKLTTTY